MFVKPIEYASQLCLNARLQKFKKRIAFPILSAAVNNNQTTALIIAYAGVMLVLQAIPKTLPDWVMILSSVSVMACQKKMVLCYSLR